MSVPIHKIRTDGGTQTRAAISEATVAEYAEAMADPDTVFPPAIVYFDGTDYWLADGFHRVEAWRRIGRTDIPTDIRQGDRRRAILHSVAANSAHGLRRTNEDKRRAVLTLLEDDEWSTNTDQWIADTCRVGRAFVAKMRAGIMPSDSMIGREPVVRTVTRNGKTYQMNVTKIGTGAAKSRPLTDAEDAIVRLTRGETVYLLSTGERVKIGYTRHGARHRVEQLLTSTPMATVIAVAEGTMQDERNVHAALECDRDAGEWFICSVDDALSAMRSVGLKPLPEVQQNTANIGARPEPDRSQIGASQADTAPDAPSEPVGVIEPEQLAAPDIEAVIESDPVVAHEENPDVSALRKLFRSMTTEGQEADFIDLHLSLRDRDCEIAALKDEIAKRDSWWKASDEGKNRNRAFAWAEKRIETAKFRMGEYQAEAARLRRQVNAQAAEIKKLRASLEMQEIEL